MTTYSVTAAKSGLSRLIDCMLEGEEVVISRNGKPVAELRPLVKTAYTKAAVKATHAWLRARRDSRKGVGITSVELLRQLYEEPDM